MATSKDSKLPMVGSVSFIVGLIIAVLAGAFLGIGPITLWILVLLGILVGLLNVPGGEATGFLVAAIALLVVGSSSLGALPGVGDLISGALQGIVVFVAPAAIIVAIKQIYGLARSYRFFLFFFFYLRSF